MVGDPDPPPRESVAAWAAKPIGPRRLHYTVAAEDAGGRSPAKSRQRTLGEASRQSPAVSKPGASARKPSPNLVNTRHRTCPVNRPSATRSRARRAPGPKTARSGILLPMAPRKSVDQRSYAAAPTRSSLADVGAKLICQVTAENAIGVARSANSEPGRCQRPKPEVKSPPTISGAAVVGETLTCPRALGSSPQTDVQLPLARQHRRLREQLRDPEGRQGSPAGAAK